MNNITIPIFPLNGVIFFPNTYLPLNIFEVRYLNMVDYALSKDKMIGMIQKKPNDEMYQIGCYGKIVSFEETGDKRYVVNLLGINYFSILKETVSNKEFILGDIKIIKADNKKIVNSTRDLLIKKYSFFTKKLNMNIDLRILEKISSDELVKFISMSSPFSAEDKQMLLETYDNLELAEKLMTLFDFYGKIDEKKGLIN